jgi:hypothetical protein
VQHVKAIFIIGVCLLQAQLLRAQNLFQGWSNIQYKYIPIKDSVQIDSNAISDWYIAGIDSNNYYIDAIHAQIFWRKKPALDSALIRYRRLAISWHQVYQHKLASSINTNYVFSSTDYASQKRNSEKLIDYEQLDLNGSYGRGLSFGNNQDMVLNSNFNLQMNGYLMDSIKIEAALTDNTIPFQPEGNTSNLQEFDLISIRLSKNKHSLQLGDYNLNKPDAYFLNFTKRVQGLFFQSEDQIKPQLRNKSGLSLSMTKGTFARNVFNGSEGNQGPYRLVGNNGEQLFVVLAATEKVYVDNVLQERGENADYIINYNTNEVRFMPRRPINQYSRIQIEFEYRTNNYLNSLLYAYDELAIGKKWTIKVNAYSNQDAKNQAYQQNLSPEQKRLLAGLGDSIQYALSPNISRDSFAANKILYRIKDSTIATTTYDSIYAYSNNPNIALYAVSFSYAGKNKGDYTVLGNNANGRVYQWIAPIGGQHQGDYAAVSLLISPKAQQVISIGSEYQIDSLKKISIELAGSNYDPNTFSSIDNQNHQGFASKIKYEEQRFVGKTDTSKQQKWTIKNNVQYEHVQSQFKAIAPYRSVEFGRDWNVAILGQSPDENWASWSSQIAHKQLGSIRYEFSHYSRGNKYQGIKNAIAYTFNNQKLNTGFNVSIMQSTDTAIKSRFIKPLLFADYSFRKFIKSCIGGSYYAEHNELRYKSSDSLIPSAFYFDISSAFWHSLEQKRYLISATYFRRRDFKGYEHQFLQINHSDNLSLQLGIGDVNSLHQINFTGSYRQLYSDNSSFSNTKAEQTLLGRMQYNGGFFKRALSLGSLYEFGSGQEQKRTFTFVQVPAGQGMYNWIDYNNDGIQQLNEFILALYPDQKLFIKIFTPSDEYVKVNNINLNQSLSFEPSQLFSPKHKGNWAKLCSRISNQLAIQVSNKILNTAGLNAFNPIIQQYNDSAILVTNSSINNTLYINRSSAHWGIDYNYLSNKTQQLLTYGLNANTNQQHFIKWRNALSKTLNNTWSLRLGSKSNASGVSDGNSYNIHYWAAEPALIWMNRSVLRISSSLKLEQRQNSSQFGGEQAKIQGASVEARYSKTATGIIQLRCSFSNIQYNGSISAPVAYTMLDALKPGNNILWYINWQRRLGKGIELFIEYEGRKAGKDAIINTGRMSLRAIL